MPFNLPVLIFAVFSFIIPGNTFSEPVSTKNHESQKFLWQKSKEKLLQAMRYGIDTVKADLITGNDTNYLSTFVAVKAQVQEGARLCVYSMILGMVASKVMSSKMVSQVVSFDNLPSQFEGRNLPSCFVYMCCIFGPILEELIFTQNLTSLMDKKWGQLIVPILFGLNHYHKNIKKWFQLALYTALLNFVHVRNVYAHKKYKRTHILPSIISHILHNIVASIRLNFSYR